MPEIRAAVASGDGHRMPIRTLRLDDPRDDEVLIRVAGVGVCHTDIRIAEHAAEPIVLGHEGAGVVEAVGDGVTGLAPGDRVVMTYRSCGRCRECRAGHPAYCVESGRLNFGGRRADGTTTIRTPDGLAVGSSFFGQSSFATHALATQNNAVKIPATVPDELLPVLGPLGCGIQTGAGAVLNSLGLQAGDTLVIAGAGGVGLSALLAARWAGAGRVVVVDVVEERLDAAMRLGADATIHGRRDDVVARIAELTDGGADLALDTTADMRVIRQLVAGCRMRATIGVLGGSQPGTELMLDYRDFYIQGRTLTGIIQGDAQPHDFIPRLLDAHLRGLFPFDRLIRRYAFDDLGTAIADSVEGRAVKAVAIFP